MMDPIPIVLELFFCKQGADKFIFYKENLGFFVSVNANFLQISSFKRVHGVVHPKEVRQGVEPAHR